MAKLGHCGAIYGRDECPCETYTPRRDVLAKFGPEIDQQIHDDAQPCGGCGCSRVMHLTIVESAE